MPYVNPIDIADSVLECVGLRCRTSHRPNYSRSGSHTINCSCIHVTENIGCFMLIALLRILRTLFEESNLFCHTILLRSHAFLLIQRQRYREMIISLCVYEKIGVQIIKVIFSERVTYKKRSETVRKQYLGSRIFRK